jgi:DNA-binding protein H-NS
MATKSLRDIEQQIASLNRQAAEMRANEVATLIPKIREAIDVYGLTAQDLFGKSSKTFKAAQAPKVKATNGKAQGKRAKYRDPESGATWTGKGRRPGWFVAALSAGKTAEQLRG